MKRLLATIGVVFVMAPIVAGCGDDSNSIERTRVDHSSDSHPVYSKSVHAFGHDYNCLIYSHASAEEGGIWCERVEAMSTTEYNSDTLGSEG